jgi:hypothetical protein
MLTLKLNDNQIPSIEPGSFGGMPNLQMLILERNRISSIESGDFSTMTNLGMLYLGGNDISSIESGAFGGMNLGSLYLDGNDITSIGSGAFSNLMNLRTLSLSNNRSMTHLNMEGAGFSSLLQKFHVGGNTDITSVSLKDAVLNQTSLETLLDGGTSYYTGIGELGGITELDLSGVDFSQITDLAPLGAMDDLTDLWLLDVSNMDAVELDSLLDNLATMQAAAIEGILYLTPDDYNALNTAGGGLLAAWDNEDGHHVEIVPEPATLSLLALGGLAVIRRRRRKQ